MNTRLIKASLASALALFATSALALNPAKLIGTWTHNGQLTNIHFEDRHFRICNEQNQCAQAFLRNHRLLDVPQWHVSGVIEGHGSIISWNNGTRWIKEKQRKGFNVVVGGTNGYPAQQGYQASPSPRFMHLSGPWMHAGRPTSLHISGDGKNFTITNEEGVTSSGYIEHNGDLVLPTHRIVGKVRGNRIDWSNNTTWYRR